MTINLKKGSNINLSKDFASLRRLMVGLSWNPNERDSGFAFDLDASAFIAGESGRVTHESDFIFYNNWHDHTQYLVDGANGEAPRLSNEHPGDNQKAWNTDLRLALANPQMDKASVRYMGDNRTGDGEGDDEQIIINLPRMKPHAKKVMFTATIYDWEKRRQNFGQIPSSAIRLVDLDVYEAYVKAYNERNKEALAANIKPSEEFDAKAGEIARYDLQEDFSTETGMIFGELYLNGTDWKFRAIGQGYNNGLEALVNEFVAT